MGSVIASRAAKATGPSVRFHRAETAVWARYGLRTIDRPVDIATPRIRLRVSEVGAGRPILLVHGTIGPAAWASLVAAMPGAGRFIVIDRPGWGGSDPIDYGSHDDYHGLSANILAGVLDRLGIERATVIGGSIGDVWAMSLAERHPARVERVVLLGGGPLLARVRPPSFIRLLASPLGALVVRLPVSANRTRSILVDSGHAASLADGRIPPELIDYRVSLSNDTRAMRHERDMVRHLVRGARWRPDLPFDESDLGRVDAPTLVVVGSRDNIGDPATWRAFAGSMPAGQFELVDGAGHMPWFDAPAKVAGHVRRFIGVGAEP
jgi:2-hydroxy-6-oxonona-2,4-dienedioate hydrolase